MMCQSIMADQALKNYKKEGKSSKGKKEPVSDLAQGALPKASKMAGPTDLTITNAKVLTFADFPPEILFLIMNHLSRKDRLKLEETSKFFGDYMSAYWQRKIEEQHLDLTFAIQQGTNWRQRYLFAKTTVELSKVLAGEKRASLKELSKLARKYEWVESSFPNLHRLIQFTLYQKGHGKNQNPFFSECKKEQRAIFSASLKGSAGDLMLQGLLEYESSKSRDCFKAAAVGNRAAAQIAVTMPEMPIDAVFKIALTEAEKGNFEPLDLLLDRRPDLAKKCDKPYPPILVVEARHLMFEGAFEEAERLLEIAMESYGQNISSIVLELNGAIKVALGKDKEAEEFLSVKTLVATAQTLKNLDAMPFERNSINAKRMRLGFTCLVAGADLKMKLGKWEEAHQLYCLSSETLAPVHKKIGELEEYKEWEESYHHYCLSSETLASVHKKIGETEMPDEYKVGFAYVKAKLGKWEEARALFEQLYKNSFMPEYQHCYDFLAEKLAEFDESGASLA